MKTLLFIFFGFSALLGSVMELKPSIFKVVVVFLICCALLGILLTPLLLLYSWVYYSFKYVKQFRDKFSVKKWVLGKSGLNFESFSKLIWMNYRETYSKMLGFGLAVLAYAVSSSMYMYKNFNKLEDALLDYFSFPFKVLDNFNQIGVPPQNEGVPSELWQEMYLIVGISFLVFFIGYFIGRLVVSLRYGKLKKEWQQQQVSIPPHKFIILE